MPRKILRALRIDEISAVDKPAQAGARFTLMKRAVAPSDDKPVTKGDTPMDGKKYEDMTDAEKAAYDKTMADKMKKAGQDAADLAKANQIIALKAGEREHYDTLKGDDADAFLKMDEATRTATVDAAKVAKAESDPVIYKSANGTDYRNSDDPRMVDLAKQADDNAKQARIEKAAREDTVYMKRAGDELGNLGGSEAGRAALLKAVDGIEDEDARKEAAAALKSANDAADGIFETNGVRITKGDPGQAVAKSDMEAGIQEIMKRDNCTRSKAMTELANEKPDVVKAAQGKAEAA